MSILVYTQFSNNLIQNTQMKGKGNFQKMKNLLDKLAYDYVFNELLGHCDLKESRLTLEDFSKHIRIYLKNNKLYYDGKIVYVYANDKFFGQSIDVDISNDYIRIISTDSNNKTLHELYQILDV